MNRLLLALCLGLIMTSCWAQTEVERVRVWASDTSTRLVFDISEPTDFNSFTLPEPDRLVIDLRDSRWLEDDNPSLIKTGIAQIRRSNKSNGDLRVVLDLKEAFKPDVFLLKPQGDHGHRLVVDLERLFVKAKPSNSVKPLPSVQSRDFIVAIDSGHGGQDPGAIGRKFKTREKDIVLSVAKKLERLINREPGMRAYLVRTGDYYVGLRKRMQIARQQGADLFISLHADSFKNTKAEGASVYILSSSGASSEAARWLAERENLSDLVGGVSLDDKGDVLAQVLLDLSQTANLSASEEVAQTLLGKLSSVAKIHQSQVQRAGFAVLKSPDVPSVLVELGFISNSSEEANLRTPRYQDKLAAALRDGIKEHFASRPRPLQPIQAASKAGTYVVKRGDTLSQIASKLDISADSLRTANNLRSDRIYVGQSLTIPRDS